MSQAPATYTTKRTLRPATDPLVSQLGRMERIVNDTLRALRREQRWFREGTANDWDIYQTRVCVRWAVAQVRAQRAYLVSIGRRAA